jgi:hypothetical protein
VCSLEELPSMSQRCCLERADDCHLAALVQR